MQKTMTALSLVAGRIVGSFDRSMAKRVILNLD